MSEPQQSYEADHDNFCKYCRKTRDNHDFGLDEVEYCWTPTPSELGGKVVFEELPPSPLTTAQEVSLIDQEQKRTERVTVTECPFDDLYIGSVSGGDYQIVHLNVLAKHLNEPFKEMLRTADGNAVKAKALDEFVKWMQHQDQEYIRLDYPEIMTELEGER